MSGKRRRFGSVRRRDSGRWQARYRGPDGRIRSAPQTFERKSDAERYLSLVEAQIMRGEWADPLRQKIKLRDYAEAWIDQRAGLRPRTIALYRWLLRRHIIPHIGDVPLGKLDTSMVRSWRSELLSEGVSQSVAAKSYRLLRAVLMTAVKEDHVLVRNPCQVKGADRESAPERPVLSVEQVLALAEAVPRRYRALILVAAFAGLRYGELMALQRRDVEADGSIVRVRRAYVEVQGKGLVLGPPKSRAGVRSVALPAGIAEDLRSHLAEFVDDGLTSLVFAGPKGAAIRRSNFNKLLGWKKAVANIGVPDLHFHDLRHTGNVLAAQSQVSTRDLMARMGHDSMRAALIYQHATSEAGQTIAASLDAQIAKAKKASPES